MTKTILKLRPNDYWKIGEHESWFTDMAKQGLHLKKTGILFTHFEKGQSKNTKYRIDVTTGSLSVEQKNLYQEYGWDYVTSYGKFRVFSSPEERNAPELHTEPGEQSYTLSMLNKQHCWLAVFVSIAMILFFAIMFSMFFLNNTPYRTLVTGQSFQQLILILVELYVLFSTIQAWSSIRSLRRSLLAGNPIDHHADWRKNRWKNNTLSLALIMLSLVSILLPVMSMIKAETTALPLETDLPIIRLAEIEENTNLKRDAGYSSKDGLDRSNQYQFSWSPVAPVQYETEEHGLIADQQWKDGSGSYSPSIHTQYYEVRFPEIISDGLLRDLMKHYIYEEEEKYLLQNIESDVFEYLYVMEDEEEKQIFAAHGNQVWYIRYYGYASTEKLLSLTEKL